MVWQPATGKVWYAEGRGMGRRGKGRREMGSKQLDYGPLARRDLFTTHSVHLLS